MVIETLRGRNVVQMSDTVPVREAECEANEFGVALSRRDFVGIVDDTGENSVLLRMKDIVRVYVKECHYGWSSIPGYTVLGRSRPNRYQVELGEGNIVNISGEDVDGSLRSFRLRVPDGMTIQTDGVVTSF